MDHRDIKHTMLANNIEYVDTQLSQQSESELELVLCLKSFIYFKRFLKNVKSKPVKLVNSILSNEQLLENILNLTDKLAYSSTNASNKYIAGYNNGNLEEINLLKKLISRHGVSLPLLPNAMFIKPNEIVNSAGSYGANEHSMSSYKSKIYELEDGVYLEVLNLFKIVKLNRNYYYEFDRNLPLNYKEDGCLQLFEDDALFFELLETLKSELVSYFDALNGLCNHSLENSCAALNKLVQQHLTGFLQKLFNQYAVVHNYLTFHYNAVNMGKDPDLFDYYADLLARLLESLVSLHYVANVFSQEQFQQYHAFFSSNNNSLLSSTRLIILQDVLLSLYALNNPGKLSMSNSTFLLLSLLLGNKISMDVLINYMDLVVASPNNILKLVTLNIFHSFVSNPSNYANALSGSVNGVDLMLLAAARDEPAELDPYISLYLVRNKLLNKVLGYYASNNLMIYLHLLTHYVLPQIRWKYEDAQSVCGANSAGADNFDVREEIYNYAVLLLFEPIGAVGLGAAYSLNLPSGGKSTMQAGSKDCLFKQLIMLLIYCRNELKGGKKINVKLLYNLLMLFSKLSKLNPNFYIILQLQFINLSAEDKLEADYGVKLMDLLLGLYELLNCNKYYKLSTLLLDLLYFFFLPYSANRSHKSLYNLSKEEELAKKLMANKDGLLIRLLHNFNLNINLLSDLDSFRQYLQFYRLLFTNYNVCSNYKVLMEGKIDYFYKFLIYDFNNYVKTNDSGLIVELYANLHYIFWLLTRGTHVGTSSEGLSSLSSSSSSSSQAFAGASASAAGPNNVVLTTSPSVAGNLGAPAPGLPLPAPSHPAGTPFASYTSTTNKGLLYELLVSFINNNIFVDLLSLMTCNKNYENITYNQFVNFNHVRNRLVDNEKGDVPIVLLELVLSLIARNKNVTFLLCTNYCNLFYTTFTQTYTFTHRINNSEVTSRFSEELNLISSLKLLSVNHARCLNAVLSLAEMYTHYAFNSAVNIINNNPSNSKLIISTLVKMNVPLVKKEDLLEYLVVLSSFSPSLVVARLVCHVVCFNYYAYYLHTGSRLALGCPSSLDKDEQVLLCYLKEEDELVLNYVEFNLVGFLNSPEIANLDRLNYTLKIASLTHSSGHLIKLLNKFLNHFNYGFGLARPDQCRQFFCTLNILLEKLLVFYYYHLRLLLEATWKQDYVRKLEYSNFIVFQQQGASSEMILKLILVFFLSQSSECLAPVDVSAPVPGSAGSFTTGGVGSSMASAAAKFGTNTVAAPASFGTNTSPSASFSNTTTAANSNLAFNTPGLALSASGGSNFGCSSSASSSCGSSSSGSCGSGCAGGVSVGGPDTDKKIKWARNMFRLIDMMNEFELRLKLTDNVVFILLSYLQSYLFNLYSMFDSINRGAHASSEMGSRSFHSFELSNRAVHSPSESSARPMHMVSEVSIRGPNYPHELFSKKEVDEYLGQLYKLYNALLFPEGCNYSEYSMDVELVNSLLVLLAKNKKNVDGVLLAANLYAAINSTNPQTFGSLNQVLFNLHHSKEKAEHVKAGSKNDHFVVLRQQKINNESYFKTFQAFYVLHMNRNEDSYAPVSGNEPSSTDYNSIFKSSDFNELLKFLQNYDGVYKLSYYKYLLYLLQFLQTLYHRSTDSKNLQNKPPEPSRAPAQAASEPANHLFGSTADASKSGFGLNMDAPNPMQAKNVDSIKTIYNKSAEFGANAAASIGNSKDCNGIKLTNMLKMLYVFKDYYSSIERGKAAYLVVDPSNKLVRNYKYELFLQFLKIFGTSHFYLETKNSSNLVTERERLVDTLIGSMYARVKFFFSNAYNEYLNMLKGASDEELEKLNEYFMEEILLSIQLFNASSSATSVKKSKLLNRLIYLITNSFFTNDRGNIVIAKYEIFNSFINIINKFGLSVDLLSLVNQMKLFAVNSLNSGAKNYSEAINKRMVNLVFEKLLLLYLYNIDNDVTIGSGKNSHARAKMDQETQVVDRNQQLRSIYAELLKLNLIESSTIQLSKLLI